MTTLAKHLVSKKKRRLIEDGFDLDMTFITKNIVAMGFPSEGTEGLYRNSMKDVKRFFDKRHFDHYKVYNLCSERDYDPQKFYGRVAKYAFDDHNAPPFQLMKPFCEDVHQYLSEDERNVAVIHCKAGKGRTGVMICAYLLHCGMWADVKDALEFYGIARTSNGKGVTIPSQIRYVHLYSQFLKEKREYVPRTLIMKKIVLKGIPNFQNGSCVPQFTIRQGTHKALVFKSGWYEGLARDQEEAVLALHPPTPVCGDVKVEFMHRKSTGKEKMFHMWFNTFFIGADLKFVAVQSEIDKANKDKKNKVYPKGFSIEIYFDDPEANSEGKGKGASGASADTPAKEPSQGSDKPAVQRGESSTSMEVPEWSDSDLTTTEEDEDEWEGLPISDV